LAAIAAGASSVDVTVGGLGERAGNAPLEEVVMAARLTLGRECGIDARQLQSICEHVGRVTGRAIPENKPITGGSVFRHESGVHVRGLLADGATYEPFPAREVGRRGREIVLGKHSGRASVVHLLARRGLDIGPEKTERLLTRVRKTACGRRGAVTEAELLRMYANDA
jgi:homocitrate synthase NifV